MKNGKRGRQTPGFFKVPYFLGACRLLAESGAQYLVVGGIAVNLHGLARTTKDLDLLIPKNVDNAEKILKALSHLTWGIAGELDPQTIVSKPFNIIGDMPRVDLLLRAGKIKFEDAFPKRKIAIVDGVKIPYVNLKDLILSKDTGRPFDEVEVRELKRFLKKQQRKSRRVSQP